LTNVSVRMLHHYDKIGLLIPAVRASNGYRLYNEQNLATLQQIIALKFFGFSLSQIKTMLQKGLSIKEHLLVQQRILKEQTEHLKQAHDALENVIQQYTTSDSLAWNDLISLIERYRMAEEIKKDWNRSFDNLKNKYPKEVEAWEKMVELINSKQVGNPEGPDGKQAAEIFQKFTKAQRAWGKTKTAQNARKNWEKHSNEEILQQFQAMRTMDTSLTLDTEGSIWFGKALGNYYISRWNEIYQEINKNIKNDPEKTGKKVIQEWRELIDMQTMGMPSEVSLGLKLWQEMSDSQKQLQEVNKNQLQGQHVCDLQKKQPVPLYLDVKALTWLYKAFQKH